MLAVLRLVPTLGHRLAVLIALLCVGGCTGSGEDGALAYRDLLTEGSLVAPGGVASAGLVGCGDETYNALTFAHGAALAAEVALGEAPSLVLGGCRDADAPSVLVLQVEPRLGPTRRIRVPIAGEPGAFAARVRLDELANQRVDLRFEPHFATGTVFLEDVYIEHRQPRPRPAAPPTFQALLISIDTLRADAIAALGGRWPTPNLDRLVAEGEVFTDSWAAASWTKPSHASMLTGELPAVHASQGLEDALHPAVPTLAERLAAGGAETGAVVQDIVHLDPRFGFGRGFGDYRVEHWSFEQMARHAVDWMGARRDRRFFYFLHTFETHSDFRRLPYEAPTASNEVLAARFGLGAGYGCADALGVCASERLDAIRSGSVAALAGEAGALAYLYGESVRHADRVLGRLIDDLESLGLWHEMLVVVTSDHGEMLLEGPRQTLHGIHQPAVLRVPLIVKWPASSAASRRAGTRRSEPVSALDLVPTLLAAAGLDRGELPGADLAGRLDPARRLVAGSETLSLVGGGEMLIRAADSGLRLLDLTRGPPALGTAIDDAARSAALDRQLAAMLARAAQRRTRFDAQGTPTAPALSDEERTRLRALGYTGG